MAASAMRTQEAAQAVIANNLANVATPGFRGDVATFKAFHFGALTRKDGNVAAVPIGLLGAGAAPDAVLPDLSPGALEQTGNGLDVAVRAPDQFFVVRTATGEQRLTRAGAFSLDADGRLVDASGHAVVGKNGQELRVPAGATATIDGAGNLLAGGQVVGSVQVVALVPGARLFKEGGALLRAEASAGNAAPFTPVAQVSLAPGVLERSNVSAVTEMVGMISAMRAYEAAAKVLKDQDETLGRALGEVARAS